MIKKVWTLPARENWICDRLVDEWNQNNLDMITFTASDADIIWLLSDWCWRQVPFSLLKDKKVVTTVHHIVPEKFGKIEQHDFNERDIITDHYHVYNQRTYNFIRPLTMKPITMIPYWANKTIWHKTDDKIQLRHKYQLPSTKFLIGSFQRDTEGHDLISPKLEKGPDLLADFIIESFRLNNELNLPSIHVILAGWRRQYIMKRLDEKLVPYTFFERPKQEILNELYQTLDLYPITARHEGGPQAFLECGLLRVPVVSRPVGIAEQVLPLSAIAEDVCEAAPHIPDVQRICTPKGYTQYRDFFQNLK